MECFRVVAKLLNLHHFSEFVEQFHPSEDDFILTNRFLYDSFMGEYALPSTVVFQEEYGAGEPTDVMAEAIAAQMKGKSIKRIIAIGGGTVIDIAKLLALKTCTPICDLFAHKFAPVKDKELIIIPTTCGTGSEVTNISILTLTQLNTKLGLADDNLFADYAVLIPELLAKLPFKFFATSSIDALIHASESFVSPKATEFSKVMSVHAIQKILSSYLKINDTTVSVPLDIVSDVLTASTFAGIAFSNAGTGAVHAMSYPFGAKYHVPHGEANYAFFTEIFETYLQLKPQGAILELCRIFAKKLNCKAEDALEELQRLLEKIMERKRLSDYGVTAADVPDFTANVMEKQGRLTANNFTPLDKEKVAQIYTALL